MPQYNPPRVHGSTLRRGAHRVLQPRGQPKQPAALCSVDLQQVAQPCGRRRPERLECLMLQHVGEASSSDDRREARGRVRLGAQVRAAVGEGAHDGEPGGVGATSLVRQPRVADGRDRKDALGERLRKLLPRRGALPKESGVEARAWLRCKQCASQEVDKHADGLQQRRAAQPCDESEAVEALVAQLRVGLRGRRPHARRLVVALDLRGAVEQAHEQRHRLAVEEQQDGRLGIEGARTNNVTQRARAAPLRRSRRPRLQLLADLRDGAMAARGGRRATLGAVEWRRGEQVRRADHRGGRARAHDGSLGRAAERLGDA
mmetsp:Transcript_33633/g.92150  ORF Transcript_33633/g.92150 Transcript_33633/m.92150 type:complete len:317 (+) Transcript_33633:358-1308(+)